MKKLLKEYDLTEVYQYYDMIIDSVINGQREQAKVQFLAMPKDYQKRFLIEILFHSYSDLTTSDKEMFVKI